jgi:pimeloyl-ACP methyl ester carboxylesterase
MSAQGKFVTIEPGVELFVQERGSGTPLILIPGWTFTAELFTHQLDHFADSYRVITYDPRGHGRSTVTATGNDYTTHGTDLAHLLDALGVENPILLGWSFGCLTLWEYVRQHGVDNIRAAIQVDLSPTPLSVDPDAWVEGPLGEIGDAYNAYLRNQEGQRGFVEYYATEVMVQRDLTPDELFWIIDQSIKTPTFVAAALFASGMFSNYMEEAKMLDGNRPVLCIAAEHWGHTAVAYMNAHCPNTKTAVLGGHMMFWEHAAAFNNIVTDFLAEALS